MNILMPQQERLIGELGKELPPSWTQPLESLWITKMDQGAGLPALELGMPSWDEIGRVFWPKAPSGMSLLGHDPEQVAREKPLVGIVTPHATLNIAEVTRGSGLEPNLLHAIFMHLQGFRTDEAAKAKRWKEDLGKHLGTRGRQHHWRPKAPEGAREVINQIQFACMLDVVELIEELMPEQKREELHSLNRLIQAASRCFVEHGTDEAKEGGWNKSTAEAGIEQEAKEMSSEAEASKAPAGILSKWDPDAERMTKVIWSPWGGDRLLILGQKMGESRGRLRAKIVATQQLR